MVPVWDCFSPRVGLFIGDVEHQIAASHQVCVLDTGILKHLAVEGHFLEMRALALQRATKRLAVVKLQCPTRNQRCMKQVVALSGIGIETQHVKGKPRGHRPAVVIARQAVGCIIVVLGDNLPHTV